MPAFKVQGRSALASDPMPYTFGALTRTRGYSIDVCLSVRQLVDGLRGLDHAEHGHRAARLT
jgi:hypothetical protein